MKFINYIVIESFNQTIDIHLEGAMYFGNWDKFSKDLNFPFDDENIFSLHFEVDRNYFDVERPGGVVESGQDVPEIKWLKENLEKVKELARACAAAEVSVVTGEQTRSGLLASTDWLILRHVEQSATSSTTTLTESQYQELLAYRQQLRDLSKTVDLTSPEDTISWPEAPSFL